MSKNSYDDLANLFLYKLYLQQIEKLFNNLLGIDIYIYIFDLRQSELVCMILKFKLIFKFTYLRKLDIRKSLLHLQNISNMYSQKGGIQKRDL